MENSAKIINLWQRWPASGRWMGEVCVSAFMECLKYNRWNCNAHFCCFKYWVFHEGRYHCYGILIKLKMFDPFFRASPARLSKNRRGLFAPPEFISIVISFSLLTNVLYDESYSTNIRIHLPLAVSRLLDYYFCCGKFKNSNSQEIFAGIIFVYAEFITYRRIRFALLRRNINNVSLAVLGFNNGKKRALGNVKEKENTTI